MAFKKEAFADDCVFSLDAGYAKSHQYTPVSDDLEFSLRVRNRTGRPIVFSPNPKVLHRVYANRLRWRYVTAKAQEVGRCRRILRRRYSEEFGSFEQENQVLRGMFRIAVGAPKAFSQIQGLLGRNCHLALWSLYRLVLGI